jgi:hypothetical protein
MMRTMMSNITGLSLVAAVCLALSAQAQGQDTDPKAKLDAIKKQVEELEKKLDALREKEKAALKALERKAEEKDYYSKMQVDVKGRLQRSEKGKGGWTVTAKGTTWHLDFGENKEWVELAKKLEGKTVQVTGSGAVVSSSGYVPVVPRSTTNFGYGNLGGAYGGGWGMPGAGLAGGYGAPGGPGYEFYFQGTTTTFSLAVEAFKAP